MHEIQESITLANFNGGKLECSSSEGPSSTQNVMIEVVPSWVFVADIILSHMHAIIFVSC